MSINYVGTAGKVKLLSGGGKIFTDIAARFVGSERSLDDIVASKYDKQIVDHILKGGHKAATEFDYFLFGIEGYSRVTEIQLVRKRLASYMIKSGRKNKNGHRGFDVIIPQSLIPINIHYKLNPKGITTRGGTSIYDICLEQFKEVYMDFDIWTILDIIDAWYHQGLNQNVPEEELRYMKPQATEFKAIIGMNAHALMDWFAIRCCQNAQTEIRDLAMKMLRLCKNVAPDLFKYAGPSCKSLGYCPENQYQNLHCVGNIPTQDEMKQILKEYKYKQQPQNRERQNMSK